MGCWSICAAIVLGLFADLDAELAEHFRQTTPELFRYSSGVAIYGASLTDGQVTKEVVEAERKLFAAVKDQGQLKSPGNNVLGLCHNLLIHDPGRSKEILQALVDNRHDPEPNKYFSLACVVAGKEGEAFAAEHLRSADLGERRLMASFFSNFCIHRSNVDALMTAIEADGDDEVKYRLCLALSRIGERSISNRLETQLKNAKSDQVQFAAMFGMVEILGYDAIPVLQGVQPVGPKSTSEKADGLKWLEAETSRERPYGDDVGNDSGFVGRFADLNSPAMNWLRKKNLLDEKVLRKPRALEREEKAELLDSLIESKCFGIEACKGALFLCVEPADEAKLLRLYQVAAFSPSAFTQGELKTAGILLRRIRRMPVPSK